MLALLPLLLLPLFCTSYFFYGLLFILEVENHTLNNNYMPKQRESDLEFGISEIVTTTAEPNQTQTDDASTKSREKKLFLTTQNVHTMTGAHTHTLAHMHGAHINNTKLLYCLIVFDVSF